VATAKAPHIVHRLPGRVRIHVPAISRATPEDVQARVERMPGVRRARANDLTRNVLVEFDAGRVDPETIVERMQRLRYAAQSARGGAASTGPRRDRQRPRADTEAPRRAKILTSGRDVRRARVAVRGLDRDPDLSRRLVDRLSRRPEVHRVLPNPLTNRVLIELVAGTDSIQEILEEIAKLEPQDAKSEKTPAHPLDPVPIIEGGAKAIGTGLGLVLLLARRIVGAQGAPVARAGPGEVAGAIGLVEGFPPVAHRVEDKLGHQRKELLFGVTAIVSMSASASVLGLALAGASAVRLLTESLTRRRAWRDYEHGLGEHRAVHPGAVLELAEGQRAPMGATVIEGFGVGSALDSSPQRLFPGATMDPGACVYGGPVTVELLAGEKVQPTGARPSPPTTVLDRYLRSVPYVSLIYAVGTGVVTRSPARALTALLLVNPVAALSGEESADRGAAVRAMRAGVVVVGSRRGRVISRPDVLIIDEPRTLCRGWELTRTRVFSDAYDKAEILGLARAISRCPGVPWDLGIESRSPARAGDARFDGVVASAEIEGERWMLEPAASDVPGERRHEPDEHVLVLRRQRDRLVAGALTLRPHLIGGIAELVQACDGLNVGIDLATRAATPRARRIADRAGLQCVESPAAERVLEAQGHRERVFVIGDSVSSGAAFDRCDLAIGLSSGVSESFPARADLLAPGLEAVATVIEAAGRRDAAVRDSAALSAAANLGGAAWGALQGPPFRLGNVPGQAAGLVAVADGAFRLWDGKEGANDERA